MYRLLIVLSVVWISSCSRTTSQVGTQNLSLEESFEKKDEQQFLKQFPTNFEEFHQLFGWDGANDKPGELYEAYEGYVDHWFSLISTKTGEHYEKYIIDICKGAEWQPKGIDHFQNGTIAYIKEQRKYALINDLNEADAFTVLFFLFHSPDSEYDEEFGANLDLAKGKMLRSLFLLEEEEVESEEEGTIESYLIDLNGDRTLDKIRIVEDYSAEDEYDRSHFGLLIELQKGEGKGFQQWESNERLFFRAQNGCISEGFDTIYVNQNEFTIIQQGCYDYTVLVNSSATFIAENGEVYLSNYEESFFDKQDHDKEIPARKWTQADFGKVKLEDVTVDFLSLIHI